MNALWSDNEAAQATGGKNTCAWRADGVSIDTRTLQSGDLFVALKAERDGHDFVAEALAKGAAVALVTHRPDGVSEGAPLLIVDDVLRGLEALGRAARARFTGKLVAVTGSVGKTGTKEMLRRTLGAQGKVHAAEKSYNNHWGVPLTLARMPEDAEFAVIEIGMNAPGEIAPLSRMARPHVALITAVEPVHLAAFRDVTGIAREKASIVEGVEPGGTLVLNQDTTTYDTLLKAAQHAGVQVLRFGSTDEPEYRFVEARMSSAGTAVSACGRGKPFLFRLGAPGRHLAMNALGALAAIDALGGDIARSAIALGQWEPPEGRGARWTILLGPGGLDGAIGLIDESYNSNPAAMAAALDVFAGEEPEDDVGRVAHGRRIAFLGDMLELGEEELSLHAGLASLPSLAAVDLVYCAGRRMKALNEALPADKRGDWFETSDELALKVRKLLDAGDIAMVKGSLGSRMGRVVNAIKLLGDARPAKPSEG